MNRVKGFFVYSSVLIYLPMAGEDHSTDQGVVTAQHGHDDGCVYILVYC